MEFTLATADDLFLLPVEEAVQIRTGEEGELVLQAREEGVSVNGAAGA